MTTRVTTPVARLVQGSLYKGEDKTFDGGDILNRDGTKAVNYWFNVAIPKKDEKHWKETAWGKEIYAVGKQCFPNGQTDRKSFSWKIIDGDSTEVPDKSKSGKRPCDWEGYAGHWIMTVKSRFQSRIFDRTGKNELSDTQVVELGDYVQVALEISGNNRPANPGVFLTHKAVAFRGFGDRITVGFDASQCGFGEDPLPEGASEVPRDEFLNGGL